VTVCYFTVVTRNYLVYADTLYESLIQVSPACKFCCLVVDAIRSEDEGVLAGVRFEILYPLELGIKNFSEMTVFYNAFELSNALKAVVMRHVIFDLGFISGVYLDSDILVFGSFDPILEAMKTASFGFTPHFTTPIPSDGLKPNDLTFLQSGIFNGGVWIFNKTDSSKQVLDWLVNASEIYGFNDQPNGMFVDQKLICQAAGIFNNYFSAINNIGCNVAYWNLHERSIERIGDDYYVNSQPLVCFHYSGYKPGATHLSLHSERFKDAEQQSMTLKGILLRYANLLERSELKFSLEIPYRFNELTGVKLDPLIRRYYFYNKTVNVPILTKFLLKFIRRFKSWIHRMDVALSQKTGCEK
jgi:lipopolysaccharide biosynthesis glycosyltransferase